MAAANAALPLEPLIALAKRQAATPDGDGIFSDKEFARMIGVSARTVARWRAAGDKLPWPAADDAATRLNEFPGRVWGEDWDDLDRDIIEGRATPQIEEEIAKAMDQIGDVLAAQAAEKDHERLVASR